MNNIKITIKKELRTIFRDKKTLMVLFLLPIAIPMFIFFYGIMFDNIEEQSNEISLIGVNFKANETEQELAKNNNIELIYYQETKELQDELSKKEIDAYINYNKTEDKYYIHYDESRQSSQISSNKVTSFLAEYNELKAKEYIAENNLDPNNIYNNILYEVVEEAGENYILTLIYNIAFTYTIMAIVIAGSNMAMSATATEKENGTLETILTLPINTSELIIGKHLGAAIMGFIVSLFSLIITIIGIITASKTFKTFESFSLKLTPMVIISSIIVIIAASLLISGLAIALTAFCKTTKEAQSKTQILNYLSIIPMFVSLLEVQIGKIFYFIPICNYIQILMDIFNNNLNYMNLFIVFISSIIYISFIVLGIIKQYKSEKVLFAN